MHRVLNKKCNLIFRRNKYITHTNYPIQMFSLEFFNISPDVIDEEQ